MEQSRLREYERRCIQEEPPYCQAACPLHVDARGICRELRNGGTDEALKTLLRTLPLPRILTCLCEQPCRERCRRGAHGGSLEMLALERFCVENGKPPRPALIPPGSKKIAVLGSGLSSLTAAWDLARKGFRVTVLHLSQPGVSLPDTLPAQDLEAELESLRKMKVTFLPVDGGYPGIEELRSRYEGIYAGIDDPEVSGVGAYDPVAFSTALDGVFAGGGMRTAIDRVSEGRRAALSIVRWLQGASLTAGREREGAFESDLYTNLDALGSVVSAVEGKEKLTPEEAAAEAARCIECQCMECVKRCTYLQHYRGYPKRYAREIYNNLSIVQGTRTANRMIDSCSNCGLCESICPNDFDMGALCLEARGEMVRQGKMPPSAHEFALLEMEQADSERASFLRHAPGTDRSDWIFFPGCQLSGSAPDTVARVYAHLAERLKGEVGIWAGCCGAPAKWAGRRDLFEAKLADMERKWRGMGEPRLILACSSCLQTLPSEKLSTVSLWEILERIGLPDKDCGAEYGPFAIFDPCTTRDMPELRHAVRRLAASAGIVFRDLPEDGSYPCCGYGGLQSCANPEVARVAAERTAQESDLNFLVSCSMCREHFAAVGKPSAHLLDLLFSGEADPVKPYPVRLTDRRENRERLRDSLLADLWGEASPEKEEYEMIQLEIEPKVRDILEQRRILDEDIRRVIFHAESTGKKMKSPSGFFIAYLKPRNVTTWVEYLPLDGKYKILNAWTHRMLVPGSEPGPAEESGS